MNTAVADYLVNLTTPPRRLAARCEPWERENPVLVEDRIGGIRRADWKLSVARVGIEPTTFRFSGGRSYQLSYLAERHPGNLDI